MKHDIFFITYDEPHRDIFWEALKIRLPRAKRIHGLKGFDTAYKACASASDTDRFFTIDGDNEVTDDFLALDLSTHNPPENAVLSWSAKNIVNGLSYGNGGIKCWPRTVTSEMRTHEFANDEDGAVDFCFQLNYLQMPGTLSIVRTNGTPYQAFRAGFREGVKMLLEKGRRPPFHTQLNKAEIIKNHVWHENLNRLRIWCSIGADVENGLWSIFGASVGAKMLCLSDWNYQLIRDYDWFDTFWLEQPKLNENELSLAIDVLHADLNFELGLGVKLLDSASSIFFKTVYVNPPRAGFMFK